MSSPWSALASIGIGMFSDERKAREERSAVRESNEINKDIARGNIALQREFAQHGIRWRVEDAEAAGIHPLAALGAGGASFSPVSANITPDMSQADKYARMGQNITRAMEAGMTADEREYNSQVRTLSLQRGQLENELLRSQISKINKETGTGPGLPGSTTLIPGQGNSGMVKEKPLERVTSVRGHDEPGGVTSVGYTVNSDGSLTPVPSADTKERIEDNVFHEGFHFLRNNIVPNFTGGKPPAGYEWSVMHQGYVPVKSKKSDDRYYGKGRVKIHPSWRRMFGYD